MIPVLKNVALYLLVGATGTKMTVCSMIINEQKETIRTLQIYKIHEKPCIQVKCPEIIPCDPCDTTRRAPIIMRKVVYRDTCEKGKIKPIGPYFVKNDSLNQNTNYGLLVTPAIHPKPQPIKVE